MALKRKLLRVGHSRVVSIPAEWLKDQEDRRGGKPITHILMDVTDKITIRVDDHKS